MGHDVVGHCAGLDFARPTHHGGHPVGAFPVGVLFISKGRHTGVGPGVHVGTVIGAVHDNGVVGHTQFIQFVEHRTHVFVVFDHGVMIHALPASGLPQDLRGDMGTEVHMRKIHPDEDRLAGLVLLFNEACCPGGDVPVHGLHALFGQRAGIFDFLAAIRQGVAVDHASRTEFLAKLRLFRIVPVFRLFFCVQVVEVPVKLIKTVVRGQHLIFVAQVILAELPGGIAQRLEQLRNRRIFLPHAKVSTRHAYLGEAGAETALAGNKGRTTGCAALFGVVVGEHHPFLGDAVDVGRLVAHHTPRVSTDVALSYIVTPDNDDVGFLRVLLLCSNPSNWQGKRQKQGKNQWQTKI